MGFYPNIKENSHKVPKVKYKKSKDPICYEISLPDIHYGKITDEPMETIEKHLKTNGKPEKTNEKPYEN